MVNLQDPTINDRVNAIEIDSIVENLLLKLDTNLNWLTHGYAKAYRHVKLKDGKKVYFPEVYEGIKDGKHSYYRPTPDNDKKGMCYFVVSKGVVEDQNQGSKQAYIKHNIGIVFWVNLKLIDSALLETDEFTQNLIAQARSVILGSVGGGYKINLIEEVREFNEIYREFSLDDIENYLMAPYSGFRFNLEITYLSSCTNLGATRCEAINNAISSAEKIDCILPTFNFLDTNVIDGLTDQQIEDIEISLGGSFGGWQRNPDWLPMPELDGTEEKFIALFAVFPDGKNFCSFRNTGAYTVDWGDGTIVNYASAASAQHYYDYSAIPSSTEIIDQVVGVYRQVLITVTPNGGTLNQIIWRENQLNNFIHQHLDVNCYLPNATTITNNFGHCPLLERWRFSVVTPQVSMASLFNSCRRLQSLQIDWTKVISPATWNISVKNLGTIDLISQGTSISSTLVLSTFENAEIDSYTSYMNGFHPSWSVSSIKRFSNINFPNVLGIASFLSTNSYLEGEVNLSVPVATTIASTFQNCQRVQKINIDGPLLQILSNTFSSCFALQEVNFTDCSDISGTTNAFLTCVSLKRLRMPGISVSFSVAGTDIDADNMEILFNDLAVATATITITGTPASGSLTPGQIAIATGKGWTVIL